MQAAAFPLCCGRFTAAETCALLREVGLRDTEPFAEVTGGDLLELSPEELVGEFGASRFQVCSVIGLAYCLCRSWGRTSVLTACCDLRPRRWQWCSALTPCSTPLHSLLGKRR